MKIPFYLSILALALCAGMSRADEFGDILAANEAKWQARQPAHYIYRYQKSCFCEAVIWQIEVENGAIKEIKPVVFGSLPPTPDNLGIDSVFEWIRTTKAKNPAELKVAYDAEFGFPTGISVDYSKLVADDETSIGIVLFKAIPQGVALSRDTVFTRNWPGVVDSQNSVRLTNTGDAPLYLNKIEMSVSPTDTFPSFGASLLFHTNLPRYVGDVGRTYLRKTNAAGMDTIAELTDALMPPGGSLLLSEFQFDPCFCLVKTAAKISDGDPVTLLLRLDFSRGEQADRVDVRAYVRVRAKYGFTSGIARRPALRGKGGTGRPGLGMGRFPAGDRVFAADGRSLAPTGGSGGL